MTHITYKVVLASRNGRLYSTPLTWDDGTSVLIELTTDPHDFIAELGLSRDSADADIDAVVDQLATAIAEQIGAGSVSINFLGERLREIRDAA